VDSGFDHNNTKANIRTGPSAFALGEYNQSIQNFTPLIDQSLFYDEPAISSA
jgi:hypothetical protein